MSEETSYIDEVAPMPEWGDDGITMEALIRSELAHAQFSFGRTEALLGAAFAPDRSEADLLRYVVNLHSFLINSISWTLLLRIQALDPEHADDIAAAFVSESQSGDFFPEMVWDRLVERGIDPERLRQEGAASAIAQYAAQAGADS